MSNAIRIQSVGMVETKAAAELVAGDRTVWNGGITYTVLGSEKLSAKFIRVAMVNDSDVGKVWYRKCRIDSRIAVL